MQALPLSAYFLFLEAAVGGVIATYLVYLRGEVSRGFMLFTGWSLWTCAALAVWLRASFPPRSAVALNPVGPTLFAAEQALTLAFVVILAGYLAMLQANREQPIRRLAPVVPLVGLAGLWTAALVEPGAQLGGLGAPLAVLAGGAALGSALAGLSLGHWYLVAPSLSVTPLIRLTFLCLGAIVVQALLVVAALLLEPGAVSRLFGEWALFFAVRVIFGLAVPFAAAIMVWRTARIRSLDSATGLMYVVAALVLAGEIAARTLGFLSGIHT